MHLYIAEVDYWLRNYNNAPERVKRYVVADNLVAAVTALRNDKFDPNYKFSRISGITLRSSDVLVAE